MSQSHQQTVRTLKNNELENGCRFAVVKLIETNSSNVLGNVWKVLWAIGSEQVRKCKQKKVRGSWEIEGQCKAWSHRIHLPLSFYACLTFRPADPTPLQPHNSDTWTWCLFSVIAYSLTYPTSVASTEIHGSPRKRLTSNGRLVYHFASCGMSKSCALQEYILVLMATGGWNWQVSFLKN